MHISRDQKPGSTATYNEKCYISIYLSIYLSSIYVSRDQKPGSTATYNGKCYIFYGQQPKQFQIAKGNHYLDILYIGKPQKKLFS